MSIKRIHSGGPYEPKVGYCRAVVAGGWVYLSGTVAREDEAGILPKTAAEQCESILSIIEGALTQAGAGFTDVVRVTYVLPDASEFEPCWPILAAAFGDNPPAAMMIEAGLIDPKYRIEIEVTAYIGG
ncbi:MAG: RidA family protein [Litoreibacter sp.]|nr:RidA family protein [Litoreibacter sp.]MCY4336396.1 RidA family protein [Litoreibacter sp.]